MEGDLGPPGFCDCFGHSELYMRAMVLTSGNSPRIAKKNCISKPFKSSETKGSSSPGGIHPQLFMEPDLLIFNIRLFSQLHIHLA